MRLSVPDSWGWEGAGQADSGLLHQERGMDCEPSFLHPAMPGTTGQESLSSVGRARKGRACLLGWNSAQKPNWPSLCTLLVVLTLVQISFSKRSPSGQVAKKSPFRAETPPKNSLVPGDPKQGKSQSYFHNPEPSPAFSPRVSEAQQLGRLCTQSVLKRWPGRALVLSIEGK